MDISEEEVWSTRDFVESLSLQFHKQQTQQEFFGVGGTVSIEGVVVKFLNGHGVSSTDDVSTNLTDFHSFLSNSKQEDSAVVHRPGPVFGCSHCDKLVLQAPACMC